MPLQMSEIEEGKKYIYQLKSTHPIPAEVTRKLDGPRHSGAHVEVRFMSGNVYRVRTSSLSKAPRACRMCGCIDLWGCTTLSGEVCGWVIGEDPPLCTGCEGLLPVTGNVMLGATPLDPNFQGVEREKVRHLTALQVGLEPPQ